MNINSEIKALVTVDYKDYKKNSSSDEFQGTRSEKEQVQISPNFPLCLSPPYASVKQHTCLLITHKASLPLQKESTHKRKHPRNCLLTVH